MADERRLDEESRDNGETGGEPAGKAGRSGFGARLAAARLARGLDESDVARALNLRVGVIAALEAEDRSRLPSLAFVRGYIRAYGRLLEFPESEVQAALADWRDPGEEERLPVSPASVQVPTGVGRMLHGHAGLVMTVLSIVAAAVVVLILIAIWPEDALDPVGREAPPEQAPPRVATPPSRVPLGTPVPRVPQQDGGTVATAPEIAVPAQPEPESAVEYRTASGTASATESAESAPATAAEAPAAARTAAFDIQRERTDGGRLLRVLAGGDDRLEVRFSEDCWVEIRDREGREVHGDLHRAGQALELHGVGPFRVLLGYAHGVAMVYNGEAVDVAPHIRNDVASLVVGR